MNQARQRRYREVSPWGRLVRLGYRLTHKPSMRHNARYLPHLRLKPVGPVWDLYWKNRLYARTAPWSDFRMTQPKVLYCVGSGPSMREQDLTPLGQAPCVLLNGAISLVGQGIVTRPYAVMVEDARFILERSALLRTLPEGTPLCLVGPALQALGQVDPALFSRFRLYVMQGFDTHYGEPKRALSELNAKDYRTDGCVCLSLNLEQGHFGCGTVMYSGVQMGFHTGAHTVRLVGFDMTNLEQPRFYESSDDRAWNGLAQAYESRILPAFRLAARTAKEQGMTLENCSHTSILPRSVLPFCDILMPKRA